MNLLEACASALEQMAHHPDVSLTQCLLAWGQGLGNNTVGWLVSCLLAWGGVSAVGRAGGRVRKAATSDVRFPWQPQGKTAVRLAGGIKCEFGSRWDRHFFSAS